MERQDAIAAQAIVLGELFGSRGRDAGMDVIPQDQVAELRRRAARIRLRDLRMVYEARLGHLGGEFSAIDILATLYFGVLRIDPTRPADPDRDRFVLSKGHSAAALYVTLAEAGFIDPD